MTEKTTPKRGPKRTELPDAPVPGSVWADSTGCPEGTTDLHIAHTSKVRVVRMTLAELHAIGLATKRVTKTAGTAYLSNEDLRAGNGTYVNLVRGSKNKRFWVSDIQLPKLITLAKGVKVAA
jgi:hypothetical protein